MKIKTLVSCAVLSGFVVVTAGCAAADPDDGEVGEEIAESEEVGETEEALAATYHCKIAKKCPTKGVIYTCRSLHAACGPSFNTGCVSNRGASYYLYGC